MEFLSLFILGALGALLTIYLAKQEVIPEFRPLFDTSEKEIEIEERKEHIKKTKADIDGIQEKLVQEDLVEEHTQRLTTVLNSSQKELITEMRRLETLEKDIKLEQILSRSLGFTFYVVLGGIFGALLGDLVRIQGMTGEIPKYFQSLVVGATWTSYMSTMGLRLGQGKVDDQIDAIQKNATDTIESLKRELIRIIPDKVERAERADMVEQPILARDVARILGSELDEANVIVRKNIDLARQSILRDVKGLL